MLENTRHVPLLPLPWSASEATAAIEEIVTDALANADSERFWPAHPQDEGLHDGATSFYFGATGTIWALEYLRRVGATKTSFDFRPTLPHLIETNRSEFARRDYSAHGSLLFGDLGTALVAMRLRPEAAIADAIYAGAEANTTLPIRELMWGMPGSMLACIHMQEMTGEWRWRALFDVQAARLLSELEETEFGPLWTQDLYGNHHRYLGPVHGYAGNMIPLLRGWNWLGETQRTRIAAAIPQTLARNAWQTEAGINWRAVAVSSDRPPHLCQHCHGAPGMVTTFADVPFESAELDGLLLKAGEFAWATGPLSKGSNLCHGTGGNGYAFLKLYRRTRDAIWLDRARDFAMTAIAQCRAARLQLGRGRYSLWTGDVGLAIYLRDCLTAEPRFPTIDVF
jgi:Lanthionine synthetase C-like protein